MQPPKHRALAPVLSSIVALALPSIGCVTEGTAVGEAESPAHHDVGRTTFEWKSDLADRTNGDIAGRLPDGTEYSGRYRQTVAEPAAGATTVDWEGNPSQYDSRADATVYTREVIARLKSADGRKELRCTFTLAQPKEGPAGGGTGMCSVSDGETVEGVVLKKAQ
ncbi:MAG: hypothetical protein HOV80_36675 [Polyangiaceae bacterium]|nr:hypothetical protein [Polyangiaceae bacterium]